MDFQAKHVIITGGSSGIGLATAHECAARGASVSLIARNPERLAAAASQLRKTSARIEFASADVSDKAQVVEAIAQLSRVQGPCDILITSAGVTYPGYFEKMDDSIFRQMMEVDYFGTLYPIQAVLPSMMERRTGSLVAISSAAGLIGVFGYTAYAPTKFAVRGLMESLRQEMKPHGIHVGVAYPPDTDTPMLKYENEFKPLETHRIAGTIKPVSAEKVARAIVKGIERNQRIITADPLTATLSRLGGLLEPLLLSDFDRKIRQARCERGLN
jgi:3-dehydrosphinganine reductase